MKIFIYESICNGFCREYVEVPWCTLYCLYSVHCTGIIFGPRWGVCIEGYSSCLSTNSFEIGLEPKHEIEPSNSWWRINEQTDWQTREIYLDRLNQFLAPETEFIVYSRIFFCTVSSPMAHVLDLVHVRNMRNILISLLKTFLTISNQSL